MTISEYIASLFAEKRAVHPEDGPNHLLIRVDKVGAPPRTIMVKEVKGDIIIDDRDVAWNAQLFLSVQDVSKSKYHMEKYVLETAGSGRTSA